MFSFSPPTVCAEVTRVFEQLGEPLVRRANMVRPVLRDRTGMEVVVKGAAAALPRRVVTDEAELPI